MTNPGTWWKRLCERFSVVPQEINAGKQASRRELLSVKPLISVVTPTFHREDLLARCVQSVLAQQVDAPFEHIVVNDYGSPLAPAPWMDDPRVRVLDTFRTERCVARNTGAALSQGQWLYFLDDDDFTLPGAFAAMLHTAQNSDAVLVYGGYQIHNERLGQSDTLQPQVPADVFPLLFAGEVLPLQATWWRRDAFFRAGGFDPTFPAAEDIDLIRRAAFLGTCVGTTYVGTSVRVEHQTTTSQWARQNEFTYAGLEKALRMPETLPRLLASTQGQPYWRGRCAREYVAAARRAFRAGQSATALARLSGAARLSRGNARRPAFLRGLRRKPSS